MSKNKTTSKQIEEFEENLNYLKLTAIRLNYQEMAQQAVAQNWSHLHFLGRLIEAETALRRDRSVQRRIRMARFPVIKSLDDFDWNWPQKINRPQVQNLFHLKFLEDHANIIFVGSVGLGKTHLSIALGYAACLQGHSVLFAPAVDIINTLTAAHSNGRLKAELKNYLRPSLLLIDELGYLPIDKKGADLLFQVISGRYEKTSTVLTTNKPYKKWAEIFNNDSTLTSAVLDRLLHHSESVLIEGKSYRGQGKDLPGD